MADEPTEYEIGLMRHALGLDRSDSEYRNHFVADERHRDLPRLLNLERLGLMERRRHTLSADAVFFVTESGKEIARARGKGRGRAKR